MSPSSAANRRWPDGPPPAERTRPLARSVAQAWDAFDRAARLLSCVKPSLPILFFGDLNAYLESPLRVVTVGLNPSLEEFPAREPFWRFPLTGGSRGREPDRYLDSMSAYFRTHPYGKWFRAFEPLLKGTGSSYYAGELSMALHTDICSPVATSPTWSKLGQADRAALEANGGPLWHALLKALRPQVVALSVARDHLSRIEFAPTTEWETIHVFKKKDSGAPRSQPYEIRARWYEVDGERSLFVFGPAAQTPFGLLSDIQKREAGAIALEAYNGGR